MSTIGQNPTFAYVDVTELGSTPASPPAGHERLYSKSDGKVYKKNSAGVETEIGSGGLTPVSQNSSFTAASGKNYLVDTSAAAVTATLPTGAALSQMRFVDTEGTWATNNLTLTPATGQKFAGLAINETLVCDVRGTAVDIAWDETNNWWAYSSSSSSVAANVEYASNDGSGGTAAGTSYATGSVTSSAGSSLVAVNSGGATDSVTRYKVTFPTAIADMRDLELQLAIDGTNFLPVPTGGRVAGATSPTQAVYQNGVQYGMQIDSQIDSTSIYVSFGNGGATSTNGYGAVTGQTWSSHTAKKWRVRKMNGASVSYPEVVPGVTAGLVAAQGLKGRTDGVAVSAGYVGEEAKATRVHTSALGLTSGIAADVQSFTLTAGEWEIMAEVSYIGTSAAGTYLYSWIGRASATYPGNDAIGVADSQFRKAAMQAVNIGSQYHTVAITPYRVSISANTAFYLTAQAGFTSGSVSAYGTIRARRIA